MPEFRQNIATKEWVIIASERAKRPNFYAIDSDSVGTASQPGFSPRCPFCAGNEEMDLELLRDPREGPWHVRAINNKFPALSLEEDYERTFDGVRRHVSGMGYHELIVDHPQHNTTFALMEPAEIARVIEMFYARGWAIRADPRIEQIIYFKNHGARAGASLPHPHCQIVAMPLVPHNIRQRTEEARRYFDDTGYCVFCVMLEDELKRQERLILETEHFVAFVLYAATCPFHIWIMPRRHSVSFLYTDDAERADLGLILHQVLRRLYVGLHDPPFNMIIRSAPAKELSSQFLHWYVTIVPRLSRQAGFELGSGMSINGSLPEECAEFLRHVDPSNLPVITPSQS